MKTLITIQNVKRKAITTELPVAGISQVNGADQVQSKTFRMIESSEYGLK